MDIRKELEKAGIKTSKNIYRNLPAPVLIEKSLAAGDGILASNGTLVVKTGERTGRSPNDKFISFEEAVKDEIAWGKINVKCPPEQFDRLLKKSYDHLNNRDIYVFDGFAGGDPKYRLAVRVITDTIWHALFANTQFIRPTAQELENFVPGFTVMGCGSLKADPKADGTKS
ncbi:MAG: phosphoenolpyruvate carboxykinase (ATP), partial [bacterium]|nr:phosphoenolpyruvate carboxykinase (ATP) [bacterium]